MGAGLAVGAGLDASLAGGLFVANYSPRGRGLLGGLPAAIVLFGLEGLYEPRHGAGHLRGHAGLGALGLSLGPSMLGAFGEEEDLGLGPELMFHVELKRGKPLLLLQVFARGDFFVRGRFGHQAVMGLKMAYGFALGAGSRSGDETPDSRWWGQ